jgi:hypothetical protein
MIFLNLYIRENVKINIIFDIQLTCGTSERACTATFHTTPPPRVPHLSQRGSACPLGGLLLFGHCAARINRLPDDAHWLD